MKVQAIRRGYGYLFNAGLFYNFTPRLTRCQLSLRSGSGHVALEADSFQRHVLKRGVFNKNAKSSTTSGGEI